MFQEKIALLLKTEGSLLDKGKALEKAQAIAKAHRVTWEDLLDVGYIPEDKEKKPLTNTQAEIIASRNSRIDEESKAKEDGSLYSIANKQDLTNTIAYKKIAYMIEVAPSRFDLKFLVSLHKQLSEGRGLSIKQIKALANVQKFYQDKGIEIVVDHP